MGLTKDYLTDEFTDMGYVVEFDTFNHSSVEQYNIICRRHGTDTTGKYMIVGAHYDTRGGPGVGDNGSGVVTVLEIAELLSDLNPRITVEFVLYSAEEVGLIGSEHHARFKTDYDNLVWMFNLDQIAGKAGELNDYIIIERDEEAVPEANNEPSHRIVDTLKTLCELYTDLNPVIDRAYSSDYMSYEKREAVIAGLYQDNLGTFGHSQFDNLENVDTASLRQVVRFAMVSVLHFADVSFETTPVISKRASSCSIAKSHNDLIINSIEPFNEVSIYDLKGRTVYHKSFRRQLKMTIDLTNSLLPGMYVVRLAGDQPFEPQKFVH